MTQKWFPHITQATIAKASAETAEHDAQESKAKAAKESAEAFAESEGKRIASEEEVRALDDLSARAVILFNFPPV